jgi:hypothetical protein
MKSSSTRRRLFTLLAVVLGGMGAACSVLLDKNKDQCSQSSDCARFGEGYSCAGGLCTPRTSSLDGATFEDGGCAPKIPKTTSSDFLNETCTDSKCIPFDNCERLGLCDAGPLPALIDPPDGGV